MKNLLILVINLRSSSLAGLSRSEIGLWLVRSCTDVFGLVITKKKVNNALLKILGKYRCALDFSRFCQEGEAALFFYIQL